MGPCHPHSALCSCNWQAEIDAARYKVAGETGRELVETQSKAKASLLFNRAAKMGQVESISTARQASELEQRRDLLTGQIRADLDLDHARAQQRVLRQQLERQTERANDLDAELSAIRHGGKEYVQGRVAELPAHEQAEPPANLLLLAACCAPPHLLCYLTRFACHTQADLLANLLLRPPHTAPLPEGGAIPPESSPPLLKLLPPREGLQLLWLLLKPCHPYSRVDILEGLAQQVLPPLQLTELVRRLLGLMLPGATAGVIATQVKWLPTTNYILPCSPSLRLPCDLYAY